MFKAREAFATFATSFSIFHFATIFCFTMPNTGGTWSNSGWGNNAGGTWSNSDWTTGWGNNAGGQAADAHDDSIIPVHATVHADDVQSDASDIKGDRAILYIPTQFGQGQTGLDNFAAAERADLSKQATHGNGNSLGDPQTKS